MGGFEQYRRSILKAAGAGVLGTSLPVSATGTPGRAETVQEDVTVSMDWDADAMVYRHDLAIPDTVSEVTILYLVLSADHFELREAVNVDKVEIEIANQTLDKFVWTGSDSPTLVVERHLDSPEFEDNRAGYYTDSEAFATVREPSLLAGTPELTTTDIRQVYRRTHPDILDDGQRTHGFGGEGYANEDFAFAGPHELASETVGETTITVVVSDIVGDTVAIDETLERHGAAEEFLGGTGLRKTEKGIFVVPDRPNLVGRAVGGSYYVTEAAWSLDEIDNSPLHEFAHTIFGTFGSGKLIWFTEAVAQYYGQLLSLNLGFGHIEEFLSAVEVRGAMSDSVLTDTETVRTTRADYYKGAHVLAALDGEIRDRTDHDRTLLDVFEQENTAIHSYDGFQQAVVEVSGDSEMADWLDEYVTTAALPELRREREYFTLPGQSPDDIATPTPTPESTATPTPEQTATSTSESASATPEPTATATPDADDSGAGFTLLGTLASVAGVGYLLNRRSSQEK